MIFFPQDGWTWEVYNRTNYNELLFWHLRLNKGNSSVQRIISIIYALYLRYNMEQLKLTQQEQVFYGEYFQTCDADGSGKISNSRASDLFVCSGLSSEVLLKVRVRWSAYKTLSLCQPKLSARSCHMLSAAHEVYHLNMFYYFIISICLQFTTEGFSMCLQLEYMAYVCSTNSKKWFVDWYQIVILNFFVHAVEWSVKIVMYSWSVRCVHLGWICVLRVKRWPNNCTWIMISNPEIHVHVPNVM